jgi:RNA polymerase sigma factor (sigma-70 family)
LLHRFAGDRDQAAFALLVERHGPLVLGVCRRVLGTVHDAEDAFQATFLVLARKAGSIRDPDLLGNWLYGVATRIARKARASMHRRQTQERQVSLLPALAAPASTADPDLGPVLDEELARLPEKYRAALVLCYLQGKTNEEAARLLRWPTGTVKGRLARARDLLRNRLVRRGLRASALVLVAYLTEARANAGIPAELVQATAQASAGFVGSGTATASPTAARLAEAVLNSARLARRVAVLTAIGAVILASLFGTTAARSGIFGGSWSTRGGPCHKAADPPASNSAP